MTAAAKTRFNPFLDICLLREIISLRPTSGDSKIWEVIATNINNNSMLAGRVVNVTPRACRDRKKTLMQAHKTEELTSLRASGTDQEYAEREQLLTDIANFEEELENRKKEIVTKEEKKIAQGVKIREAAASSLKRPHDSDEEKSDERPAKIMKKSKKTDDYVSYLREKHEAEMKIREAELNFQREKFEAEKKEKEAQIKKDEVMMTVMMKFLEKSMQ